MKIRYKHWLDVDWKETTLSDMKDILTDPKDRYEIRLPCDHKKSFVLDGIKECEVCGDTLEITSYRER
jgi:hypothetical protein